MKSVIATSNESTLANWFKLGKSLSQMRQSLLYQQSSIRLSWFYWFCDINYCGSSNVAMFYVKIIYDQNKLRRYGKLNCFWFIFSYFVNTCYVSLRFKVTMNGCFLLFFYHNQMHRTTNEVTKTGTSNTCTLIWFSAKYVFKIVLRQVIKKY